MRGYFGIGVYHPKTIENIGTLWRSAYLFNASFIFTIGRRYNKQASDTVKAYKHIPLWNFKTYAEFKESMPYNSRIVCVELSDKSTPLNITHHHEQAVYLLGAEDYGIPKEVLEGNQVIQITTCKPYSMNVAVAGSIVMYDRFIKSL